MAIRVLAFGIAKDIFQDSFAEINAEGDLSVGNLKAMLEEKYPKLRLLKSYLVAVNNEYAKDEQRVNPTDEIALIPPVSGG